MGGIISQAMKRFAKALGLTTLDEAIGLSNVANLAEAQNTHVCNGDPHPSSPDPSDKSENARWWESSLVVTTDQLTTLVAPAGMKVEYNGVRPTLRDKDGRYIYIPRY